MCILYRFLPRILYSAARNTTYRRLAYCADSLHYERSSKLYDGEQRYYKHHSKVLNTDMDFGIYLPPKLMRDGKPCPVLYFLNGLGSNHEDFFKMSAFGRFASKYGICVVSPDTSPRNVCVPPHEMLGIGASFYVDASKPEWSFHFQMFTYVTKELITLITNNFRVVRGKQSISGFSMGGYGALICFLKCPDLYRSISVFAALCNPLECVIGRMFLETYIGDDKNETENWDPTKLVEKYNDGAIEILLDQGSADEYQRESLLPLNFLRASRNNPCVDVIYKPRMGYSHNHFYMSTFINEHMTYHSNYLNGC